MTGWLRNYRRRRLITDSLPASWLKILEQNASFRSRLDSTLQKKLDRAIAIFVAEKNWEGCNGFILEDEQRVTIAAHAMRLTLGFENDYFDELESILVFPTAYEATSHTVIGPSVVLEGKSVRLGESWHRGPVILAWSDVFRAVRSPGTSQNVVLHEFAHQLDTRNSRFADGVPVIESSEEAEQWLTVTDHAYKRLCNDCRRGKANVLDCYGTTNMAEFFAVATEAFFEAPRELESTLPDLYSVFRRFYQQEPEIGRLE